MQPCAFGFISGYKVLMTSETRMFIETKRGQQQNGSSSQKTGAEYRMELINAKSSRPSAPPAIGES